MTALPFTSSDFEQAPYQVLASVSFIVWSGHCVENASQSSWHVVSGQWHVIVSFFCGLGSNKTPRFLGLQDPRELGLLLSKKYQLQLLPM